MVRKGNKQVRMKYKEEGREMGKYKEEVGEGKQKSAVEENLHLLAYWENLHGTFAKTLMEYHRPNGLYQKKAFHRYDFLCQHWKSAVLQHWSKGQRRGKYQNNQEKNDR